VADVLIVPTVQFGNPVVLFIFVVADDRLLHQTPGPAEIVASLCNMLFLIRRTSAPTAIFAAGRLSRRGALPS
jgi:hypothetical protein